MIKFSIRFTTISKPYRLQKLNFKVCFYNQPKSKNVHKKYERINLNFSKIKKYTFHIHVWFKITIFIENPRAQLKNKVLNKLFALNKSRALQKSNLNIKLTCLPCADCICVTLVSHFPLDIVYVYTWSISRYFWGFEFIQREFIFFSRVRTYTPQTPHIYTQCSNGRIREPQCDL